MKVKYTVQCPDCGHKSSVVLEKGDPLPKFCQGCGVYVGPEEEFVPSQLNIGGSPVARSVDQTYRQYEQATAERAEATGNPSLKVTNMKDNLREGDVAAMPVNNVVSQYAAMAKEQAGFNYFQAAGQASIADTIAMAKSGQDRGTGSRALEAIQSARGAPPPTPTLRGKWGV